MGCILALVGCKTESERLAQTPARVQWFLAEKTADGTFDVPVPMPNKELLYRQAYPIVTDTAIVRTRITRTENPDGEWVLLGELSRDARAVQASHVPKVAGHQLLIYLDGKPTRAVVLISEVGWFPIAYSPDGWEKSRQDLEETARRLRLEGRIRAADDTK